MNVSVTVNMCVHFEAVEKGGVLPRNVNVMTYFLYKRNLDLLSFSWAEC